jgi:hypothetical protein
MDEEDDEDEPVAKYSVILEEEDYEDEDPPESYDPGLQDNFGTDDDDTESPPEIEGWDPRESFNFFRIIY